MDFIVSPIPNAGSTLENLSVYVIRCAEQFLLVVVWVDCA